MTNIHSLGPIILPGLLKQRWRKDEMQKCLESKPKTCPWTRITCADSVWRCLKRSPLTTGALYPLRPSHSLVTGCRDEGMRGSEGRAERRMKGPLLGRRRTQGPVSCAGGRCDLVGRRSMRVRKRRTMKVSVGPRRSCRRRGGAGLTDKMARWTERRRKERTAGGVQKTETGLQTADCAPGAERHLLVWPRGGRVPQTSQHQSLAQT